MHRQEAENDHFTAGSRRAYTQSATEGEGSIWACASEEWSSLRSSVGSLPLSSLSLYNLPALTVSDAPSSLDKVKVCMNLALCCGPRPKGWH